MFEQGGRTESGKERTTKLRKGTEDGSEKGKRERGKEKEKKEWRSDKNGAVRWRDRVCVSPFSPFPFGKQQSAFGSARLSL